MYLGINISNLNALAYALEQGADNGGVSKIALASFLRSVASDLESIGNETYRTSDTCPKCGGWLIGGECENCILEKE